MECKYHYIDPTGNITVLVESSVPVGMQIDVANAICQSEPLCEQVGYISFDTTDADIQLRMAGGEFCGNATMSAAVVYAERIPCIADDVNDIAVNNMRTAASDGAKSVRVKASGAEDVINVAVRRLEPGYYAATVEMPIPKGIETVSLTFDGVKYELPLVRFDGICHAICLQSAAESEQEQNRMNCSAADAQSTLSPRIDKDTAERAIRKWCGDLGAEGLGLMLLDEKEHLLHPLVYVKAVDTMFWEHSCASGTTAVGYYLSEKQGSPVNIELHEPGGILTIRSDEKGHLYLSGHVKLCSEKQMNIYCE